MKLNTHNRFRTIVPAGPIKQIDLSKLDKLKEVESSNNFWAL